MRRLTGFRWGVIYPLAAGLIDWLLRIMMLALLAPPVAAAADVRGVADEPCPPGAIAVEPGASIQTAVDRAGDGAAFCLKNGIHRMQATRRKPGQSFYGEGQTVLNDPAVVMSVVAAYQTACSGCNSSSAVQAQFAVLDDPSHGFLGLDSPF
jgi:hypothetical protein